MYPVREASGKITGFASKTQCMKLLYKKAVKPTDPISKIVQRELRHVSLGTKLDELGRVLVRNGFVLVNKTKFCTTTDLLKVINPPEPSKGGCCGPKNGGAQKQTAAADNSGDSSMLTMAASFVIGAGLAAAGESRCEWRQPPPASRCHSTPSGP